MNNILPGFIDSLPKEESFKSRIPMGRYGTVKEIAEIAAFLLSPRTYGSTGISLYNSSPAFQFFPLCLALTEAQKNAEQTSYSAS